MNAAGDTIEQVRIDNARVTFYGHEGTRPEEHLLRDDCSNPEVNEDLAGKKKKHSKRKVTSQYAYKSLH